MVDFGLLAFFCALSDDTNNDITLPTVRKKNAIAQQTWEFRSCIDIDLYAHVCVASFGLGVREKQEK